MFFKSSVIQFDKVFHLVVLYENYLNCIFINVNEYLKGRAKSLDKLVPNGVIRPIVNHLEHFQLMLNGPIRSIKKICYSKQIHFGCMQLHGFHGNLFRDFKEWECTYKNTHHIYFSNSFFYSSKLGIKLVVRHCTFT